VKTEGANENIVKKNGGLMFKLNVTSHFSSAHKLNGYDGACKNLHGHNWKVRVGIDCEKTDKIGMTIDFGIVKKHLNELIDTLDHSFLNDLPCFENLNPTSENIARYIYLEMQKRIAVEGCKVKEVEVWESEKSSMVYYE
jgi:6-pyruvoyltetrahydropterin/6-carboxytetrahydropterin synthase